MLPYTSTGDNHQLSYPSIEAHTPHLKPRCSGSLCEWWVDHLSSLVGNRAEPSPVLGDMVSMVPEKSRLWVEKILWRQQYVRLHHHITVTAGLDSISAREKGLTWGKSFQPCFATMVTALMANVTSSVFMK